MRPEILFPAFAPIGALKGCGPQVAKRVEKVAGSRIADLWWLHPTGLIDRRFSPDIAQAPEGAICTFTVRVEQHQPAPRNARHPYRVLCANDSGFITLTFFNARADYLSKALPLGATRVISGRVARYHGGLEMMHPDRIGTPEEAEQIRRIEPVYPLTAGLSLKVLQKLVAQALERVPAMPEWQDSALLGRRGWPGFGEAVRIMHNPEADSDLLPDAPARARLAYDELLANQLALGLVRANSRRLSGRRLVGRGDLRRQVVAALPYELTRAQSAALQDIERDLASDSRMLRLLQGDVGSGKTVVALLAMLIAVESRAQAALAAPTEILARQHFETMKPLAEAAGARLAILTGRDKGRTRENLLAALSAGEIDIIVGTHALFQDDVAYRDLAFAVIDEQHRFGVHQRLSLGGKGQHESGGIDMLVMTATPIPRTLTLTAYGDMDVSRLTEKPPGRKPVDTRAMPLARLDAVVAAVRRKIETGERVYWVCPLVEESEETDLAAAASRYAELRERLGDIVGLLHGQMKAAEKDQAMADFAAGRTRILVATTVIEVGVDVPAATSIIIEHAERFGLAQLHQLRGRVGRGNLPGTCLLLYATPLGETAAARLKIMRDTEDGFHIAEEDLRLRGPGELLGTRQSGTPDFRLADLAAHADLLAIARDDANLVLQTDPQLKTPRGASLRVLLYLFERDAAVRYLRSG